MKLPEFKEFLASLDCDKMAREQFRLNYGDPDLIQIPRPNEPGYTDAIVALIHGQALELTAQVRIYMQEYHEWLSRQLEAEEET